MKDQPLVSVMMAAYNTEKYIGAAIQSIIDQTYSSWELVIVNDGSIDNTEKIIRGFQDSRIKYHKNKKNMGLAYTRNKLLRLSKGEYLAVLDSDDISLPKRLEIQVNYLQKNLDVGLLGTSIQMIGSEGNKLNLKWIFNACNKSIPIKLIFQNYFAHSTVMYRRNVLPEINYRSEFPPAEDYDLWVRMSENANVANMAKVLVLYRQHNSNISKVRMDKQAGAEKKILFHNLKNKIEYDFSSADLTLLYNLFFLKFKELDLDEFERIKFLLYAILCNFKEKNNKRTLFFLKVEIVRQFWNLYHYYRINKLRRLFKLLALPKINFFAKLYYLAKEIELGLLYKIL